MDVIVALFLLGASYLGALVLLANRTGDVNGWKLPWWKQLMAFVLSIGAFWLFEQSSRHNAASEAAIHRLDAILDKWQAGDRRGAVDEIEQAKNDRPWRQ